MRALSGRGIPADHVVVIGAGLGGLSAALRLAGAGRRVTVLEREDRPGGRAGQLRVDGYTFDTGPTVLTMPELLDDALACVGEKLSDRVELVKVDPAYRARFADGTAIDVHTDVDAMADEIARTGTARDADGYRKMVTFLEKLYRIERDDFIDRNLDSVTDFIGPSAVNALKLLALGGLRRLDGRIGDFVKDDRLRRIFSFQAMYAGLAPHDARAIYAVIAYMDCVKGVWFPKGGMAAVPVALADAAADAGVEFRYGTTVTRIETSGDRAVAVHTADGERIAADAVVVNADLPMAYRQLLDPQYTPRAVKRLTYSPSCVLMHVGSSATFADTAHHTIDFGQAWDQTFDEIIRTGRTMSDPSFLVSNPSQTDPSLAPDGRQTYYVLFPCPNTITGAHIYWATEGPRYRDEMVATMERRGFPGFGDAIEVERLVTPADWQAMGLAAGAPFAAAHSLRQTGPLRRPTLDPTLGNVVFCGSNTQPGVGVPMVLLSGRLAAQRIVGEREAA